MGMFIKGKDSLKEVLGIKKEPTYIDRVAQREVNCVLANRDKGLDWVKVQQKMLHRLAKVKRQTDKKTYGKVTVVMSSLLKDHGIELAVNQ